jgi:outer membrane biosynthesis protein TonB
MKSGLTISAIAHVGFLAWGIISFAATPLKTEPSESLPVDIMSATDFTAMMAGMKTAPKSENQKPLVEKIAPKNEVKDPTPKVAEKKPEIDNTAEAPPPPSIPEPKPKPKVAEAKPPEAKPEKLEKKPDPIAEAIKQEKPDEKQKPDKEEAAQKQVQEVPTPQKRPPRPEAKPEPKFDASKVAALLDKRAPQRVAAAGEVLNNKPALGTATGAAAALSQSELDALRAQIQQCWNPPAGAVDAKELMAEIRIELRQDGTLSAEPALVKRGSHPFFQIFAESAMRAVRRCQPYKLPIAKYEVWRSVEIGFDLKQMYGG